MILFLSVGHVLQAQSLRFLPETAALRQTARSNDALVLQRPAAAHYDVIALRVEFQPDTTRFTTGDGLFEGTLFEDLEPTVDPLPHNAGYFQAHLDFLSHYVERVSDGRTTVQTHLVPEVIRVSQPMRAYSPTGFESTSDEELRKLASLLEEAWTLASARSGFDVSAFDPATTAFVIFHAGVGRDIELIGTTLDKTPEDLPSIYFDQNALQRLLGTGALAFKGLPVNHTMLLPRTETRQGFDFIQDANFLAEFSINGLLAASFFNYLGVPDLFNIQTGESAIGPFGLMDPLGLFAFRGLFAPEPSPWTKIYLGWTDPIDIQGAEAQDVELTAASLSGSSDVARVWVSDSEYFLVENRFRDPEADGLALQIWKDGSIIEQTVENGDEEFNSIIIDSFEGGVVVGVDNYDWALPGGLDENDNPLNGGILIWHIDERRLADGLTGNGVNSDPDRRAIDVEEADSGQDLGFPSASILGPEFDLGTPFDFFYKGNLVSVITLNGQEVSLYQNRFGPDTYPNSNTNAGGPSFVTLTDFSESGAAMTFRYEANTGTAVDPLVDVPFGDEIIETRAGSAIRVTPNGAAGALRIGRQGLVFGANGDANVGRVEADEISNPVLLNDGRIAWLERRGGQTQVVLMSADRTQQTAQSLRLGSDLWDVAEAQLVLDRSQLWLLLMRDGEQGLWRSEVGSGLQLGVPEPQPLSASNIANIGGLGGGGQVLFGAEEATVVTEQLTRNWTYPSIATIEFERGVMGRDASGIWGALTASKRQTVFLLQPDERVQSIDVTPWGGVDIQLGHFPIMADLDGDTRLDVLVTYGEQLLAFNQSGALVAGFPIPMASNVTTQPLIASFGSNDNLTIITGADDGNVYAYDIARGGKQVDGFPLAVGKRMVATPALIGDALFAVAETGRVRGWRLSNLDKSIWGQQFANAQNQNTIDITDASSETPLDAALLIRGETYNWPNPIRDGQTYVRVSPTKTSRIVVTIIDQAGSLVDRLAIDQARAGIATEVLWQTDAPSGIYFARVHAQAEDGTTDDQIIRMAIIR